MSIQDGMKATSILLARLNPGPFYINTENIAGAKEAELVLARITCILKEVQPRERLQSISVRLGLCSS